MPGFQLMPLLVCMVGGTVMGFAALGRLGVKGPDVVYVYLSHSQCFSGLSYRQTTHAKFHPGPVIFNLYVI